MTSFRACCEEVSSPPVERVSSVKPLPSTAGCVVMVSSGDTSVSRATDCCL